MGVLFAGAIICVKVREERVSFGVRLRAAGALLWFALAIDGEPVD